MVVLRAGSKSASWVLGLLLAASGCGYDGELPTTTSPPTPPPPPSQAAILLSLSPSPIAANVPDDGSSFSAEWTLGVRETTGIGGDIDFVSATLSDSTGRSIAETRLDADEVSAQLGGSNHIAGGSNQELPMNLNFTFPTDVHSGDLRVTLQLSDDRDNTVSASADDVIQVCVPALLTPEEGAILDNGCSNRQNGILWEFDWDECTGAESYEIIIKQRNDPLGAVERAGLHDSSFTLLENKIVSEELRLDWTWKVRATVNGVVGDFSPERNFTVEPLNTDCVAP